MCAQISDFFPVTTGKEKDNSSSFRENINRYLYHWPLFLLCIIISITGAYFYLQLSNPSFEVKASVIIKDEKKVSDEKTKLQDIELSNSPKLAENELEVLKSHNLIFQVANELQLWITYQKKNGLRNVDLYKKSPVIFKLLDSTGFIGGQTFKIKIKDKSSFFIIKSDGTLEEFKFKNRLANNFGTWKLEPTANLSEFAGTEITIVLNNINKTTEAYQKAIDAELPNKLAPVIELSLKDQVEQRGKDILNHLITLYNETSVAEKNQITQKTLAFIDERIGSLADELNSSEKDIAGYRSSKGITDISSQSKMYLENSQSNESKLNEVKVQLDVIEGIEKSLTNSQNSLNASASLGLTYPSLNSLIEKLSLLKLQRDKLLATTPEANPSFDPINRQIKSTKEDIKENIQNIKSSLLTAQSKLQSFNTKNASSIKDIPIQERELVDKTRQQNIKENLYVYLLQKREEVALNYASILPDARIVDLAYSGSAKSSGAFMVYMIAIFVGLLIALIFIYVRNSLNNRITTRKEIEAVIGTSLFGELTRTNSAFPLVELDKGNILIGEEFRDIRTSLHFLKGKHTHGWVTLVTSSIANEGKSFVSSNLAHVMATSGKKTIILEMDLRRPKISGIFNISGDHAGISDYLMDKTSIEKIIQKSGLHPNLDFIGSGPIPPDPSDLIQQEEKINNLFDWLRANYDDIIIDTPPLNLVTDAKMLVTFSDTVLYIIRQGYTYKSLLTFIRSLIKKEQFGNVKIIFNGIEKERYGYGYNYGTEYYQAISTDKKSMANLGLNSILKRF